MFKFWGSQDQQDQPRPQESWYPPSAVGSTSSCRPDTPSGGSSSNLYGLQRPSERSQSPPNASPTEAAAVITLLKDKSVDELRKILTDKDAYRQFFLSLDQVKVQNNIRDELRKETLQLARENLEKEPRLMELRNQCRIIRTTELAAAQEKLNELERRKEELLRSCSPAALIQKLHESVKKTEDESEALTGQLLDGEIDVATFVQKCKKHRTTFNRSSLMLLAAKTSSTG